MNTRVIFAIFCFGLVIVATGCGGIQPPVPVPAAPPCELPPGGSTALTATGAQGATSLEWSASIGQLTPSQGPAVTYTAPRDYSGPVVITVIAKKGNAQAQGQMTCTVLPPPPPPPTSTLEPTATLPPTPVDTLTSTPTPLACELRQTTQTLFPELSKVADQFPIHGPVEGAGAENFHCEVVSDLVHSLPMAVHIKYEKATGNSGWWGVATPNGYNASVHRQLCFWGYAKQPLQSFRVKMKDTSGKEDGVSVTINAVNKWEQICTDISKFKELGINTEKMDNINLGFETPLGSAEIWVADFEFK